LGSRTQTHKVKGFGGGEEGVFPPVPCGEGITYNKINPSRTGCKPKKKGGKKCGGNTGNTGKKLETTKSNPKENKWRVKSPPLFWGFEEKWGCFLKKTQKVATGRNKGGGVKKTGPKKNKVKRTSPVFFGGPKGVWACEKKKTTTPTPPQREDTVKLLGELGGPNLPILQEKGPPGLGKKFFWVWGGVPKKKTPHRLAPPTWEKKNQKVTATWGLWTNGKNAKKRWT